MSAVDWRARRHPAWWAFLAHRVSGVLLALFLPAHFWALSRAIEGEARLENFLRWTESPWVRLAETGLVILLAAHLAGGLRILALEFLAWRDRQKMAVALSAGASLALGLLYLLNVF
ncbi:MAG: succinate dehydrogenase, cytochrome b556 subunit [Alphaproteobacteria bacterium]|nr:succinate dehydrogenase, cytochrome b556 subunit [Alphaproteobacteria bacterium]